MDEHKYDPLYDFLKEFKGNLTISFEDVARIIGCDELPDYAYNSKGSWWYIGDRSASDGNADICIAMRIGRSLDDGLYSFIPRLMMRIFS